MTAEKTGKLKITLRHGFAGRPEKQRATARALGLKKVSQSRVFPDNPQVRGMAQTIIHLVEVEEVE